MGKAPRIVLCDYCTNPAELVGGAVIYPHRPDLSHARFYRCVACEAWVGCHAGTLTPLGRLAKKDLRDAKVRAHAVFDPLWKLKHARENISKGHARRAAYRWLAQQLGIEPAKCHIGMFDVETCLRVVEVCSPYNRSAVNG